MSEEILVQSVYKVANTISEQFPRVHVAPYSFVLSIEFLYQVDELKAQSSNASFGVILGRADKDL